MNPKVRKIVKRVKEGRPLCGLLVGMTSAVAAATECAPARTSGAPLMGKSVRPVVQSNKASEARSGLAIGEFLPGKPLPRDTRTSAAPSGTHRVVAGDTLIKIAKKYKTTVGELKRLNGFDDERANALKVGEVVVVAAAVKEKPEKSNAASEQPGGYVTEGDIPACE